MGQANQIYARWKRLLFSPDNPNEIYIVLEKDKPMTQGIALDFDTRFKDTDVIVTITKLLRKYNRTTNGKCEDNREEET